MTASDESWIAVQLEDSELAALEADLERQITEMRPLLSGLLTHITERGGLHTVTEVALAARIYRQFEILHDRLAAIRATVPD